MQAPSTLIPSIYQIIKEGGSKLAVELAQFLSANRYCTRIIGQGSFGTIEDRTKILTSKPEILMGKPVNITNLVVKELKVKRAAEQPDHEDQVYPFYFSVIKDGKMRIVDTDNKPEVGGFASEVIANMLCTELFRRVSPHFVYMADFSYCGNRFEYYFENLNFDHKGADGQTRAMSNLYEHIYTWQNDNVVVTEDMMSGLILGVFHSLYLMRINFDMSHYDLHAGNVYIKVLNDEKYFAGENMLKFKYFAYYVGNKVYYVKNCGFIPKIGDLGLAQFTLGNTIFLNNYARSIRRPDMFEQYLQKTKGQNPDFLLFLSVLIPRFSQKFKSLERLKEIVYPFNDLRGTEPSDVFNDRGNRNFDSSKIPLLKDLLLNERVFDHLCKKPKIADSHILHIKDDVISGHLP